MWKDIQIWVDIDSTPDQFEGLARVAWVRETENGLEAGLQWERLTASEWEKAKGAFLLSQAA